MIIRNALISLYNKDGIIQLADTLKKYNVRIYATTSTAEYLENAGIEVNRTEEITGISELLGGRVKTLNTKLFAGILARKGKDSTDSIPVLFDMVIVDLYPFEQTVIETDDEDEIIEKIDIGGITLLRAAAKNFRYVVTCAYKEDYEGIVKQLELYNGEIPLEYSRKLAGKAFRRTMQYDTAINSYFEGSAESCIELSDRKELRYGENPHQKAYISRIKHSGSSIMDFQVLHGKEMSYNNYMDCDAAAAMTAGFIKPAAAVIKHTNPCGFGTGENISEAYELAHLADPKSAYGGIVSLNRKCDRDTAELIHSTFIELVIAPEYDEQAIEILSKKKNIRIIQGHYDNSAETEYRYLKGAFLVQDRDVSAYREHFDIVSKRKPNDREFEAIELAWHVCRYVKSNAIVIATPGRTMGIGAGQMSRVDSVDIAIRKSGGMAAYTGGSAMASDGFFPFRDSIDLAYKAGVYCVVEPGGSRNDLEVIKACDEYDMSLVFTGRRHFKH